MLRVGAPLRVNALRSVTTGHHVEKSEIWFHVFTQWFRSVFPSTEVVEVNGAAPGKRGGSRISNSLTLLATGSDYFSYASSFISQCSN